MSQRHSQPESGTRGWAGRLIDRLLHAETHRRELIEGLDGDRHYASTDTTAAHATTKVAEQSEAQLRAMTPPAHDTSEHGVGGMRSWPPQTAVPPTEDSEPENSLRKRS
jgi:hypothetical protein